MPRALAVANGTNSVSVPLSRQLSEALDDFFLGFDEFRQLVVPIRLLAVTGTEKDKRQQ